MSNDIPPIFHSPPSSEGGKKGPREPAPPAPALRWSDAQRAAIEARGANLLVSAAAGSGKTAVLTARIVALVREGARIDDLLIVTFTRAAAAEMRGRIVEELHRAAEGGDGWLAEQALRVERADILTLHGFCAKVCREQFHAAGADPTFRVADGAEAEVLRDQALLEALTACFENPSPAFAYAAECLSQQAFRDAADGLHRFLMARPNPWEWLEGALLRQNLTPAALAASPWMETLLGRLRADSRAAEDAYARLVDFARQTGLYEGYARKEWERARAFRGAAEQGLEALAALELPAPSRKPRKADDGDEALEGRFVSLRDEAGDQLKACLKMLDWLTPLPLRAGDLAQSGLLLAGLAEAVRAFDSRFAALKEEKNLLDFQDLERFALRALRQEAVGSALRNRYAHVFVDEYQDSSVLQEALLTHVCRGDNLFMVGDVKQSVYRFRMADPTLFLGKLAAFSPSPAAKDRRISLNANYRSHKMLLGCVNAVFDRVFTGGDMEIVYDEEARLVPGMAADWPGAPVELHLLVDEEVVQEPERPEEAEAASMEDLRPGEREAIRREAALIADRIIALRGAPEGEYRLRDMAVLMRAVRGRAAQVVETLRSRGIAAWSDLGEDALACVEVRTLIALLRAVDNLRQDLPLLAALRGPALGLSEESLAAIRIQTPQGTFADAVFAYPDSPGRDQGLAQALGDFLKRMRGFALDAQALPLDTLVRRLYSETGYYAAAGALPDGALRQANLRMLAEHAGAYQRAQRGGLGGFLRYIDRVQARDGLAAQELGERDDVVRVMSIHKSKGLEFPVVFLAGMGNRFKPETAGALVMHATLGLGAPRIDPVLRATQQTVAQKAILEKRRQERLAEEARLLYVAMTRAQRRLILVGSARRTDEERWQRWAGSGGTGTGAAPGAQGVLDGVPNSGAETQPAAEAPELPGCITPATPASAICQLDWVVPCAQTERDFLVFRHPRGPGPAPAATDAALARMLGDIRRMPEPFHASGAAAALSWRAPLAEGVPLKRSVSDLARIAPKPGEADETPPSLSFLYKRPMFLEARGLTAAERGSAVHTFLMAIPLDAGDAASAARALVDRGILSPEQADALPLPDLNAYLNGPLWARMVRSSELYRERPFILRRRENGEDTLLQGVIDCCFLENGAWVVADYKTDRPDDIPALLARYAPQVRLYGQALAQLTGRSVGANVLYFLAARQGYEV